MTHGDHEAFPLVLPGDCKFERGLTKREYFAGQIMAGILACSREYQDYDDQPITMRHRAEFAVECTDVLIAALNAKAK